MLNIALFNRAYACLLVFMLAAPHFIEAQTDLRIDVLGTCIPADPSTGGNASTKFFAHYEQPPDSVLWDFGLPEDPDNPDSLRSTKLHPIFTYPEAGQYEAQLFIWANGSADADTMRHTVNIQQTEEQLQVMDMEQEQPVQGEVVLCDEKTLQAQLGQGEEGQPVEVTWYRPQSAGLPPQRLSEITISRENVDADGKYLDAGTYFVVYNEGSCPIYQSFQVVIYNESTDNSSRWYFGDGAGINFQDGEPIQNRSMVGGDRAIEGTAMIGDANADVLFYTNGESVWYGNSHQIPDPSPLTGGDGDIGGSREIAQNSIFVEYPQDETLFYLFTINSNHQLSFATLDLKAAPEMPDDPLRPDVARDERDASTPGEYIKQVPLHIPVAEKITTASRDAGGSWVVVHELGSNNFLSYPVNEEGVGVPTVSPSGSDYNADDATGYMRISGDGNILAAAVNQGGTKFIELFRFDTDSGRVSDPVQISINETSGTLYGLELTDSVIYATIRNPGGQSYLYQFKYDSTLDKAAIEETELRFATSSELGAVQLAPDGQIYIARNGENQVYRLPNNYNPDFSFSTANDFDLWQGTLSTLGLPNFGEMAGSSPPEATVFAENVCEGEPLRISGTQRYSNDKQLFFDIINESGSVVRTYDELAQGQGAELEIQPEDYASWGGPGNYTVSLRILNECSPNPPQTDYPAPGDEPITADFIIHPPLEAEIDDSNNLILCDEQTITLEAYAVVNGERVVDNDRYHFTWMNALSNSPQENTEEVSVSGNTLTTSIPQSWYVVVEDLVTGCSDTTDPVTVEDNRPDADLGDDIIICEGDGSLPRNNLDASFPNSSDYNFSWFRNGRELTEFANQSSIPIEGIDTQSPGSYEYVVNVTPQVEEGNCPKTDTISIVVAAKPEVQIIASENNCTGSAVLTAEARGVLGDLSYLWEGPGISSGQGTAQIRIDQSGEYRLTVTDDSSGCVSEPAIYQIDLDNPLADVNLLAERECGEAIYTLSLETGYSGNDLQIRWFRGSTELPEYNGQRRGVTGEPGETYRVEVSITSGECANTESDSEDLAPMGDEDLSLQSAYTICPTIPEMNNVRLSVPGFNRYRWSKIEANGQSVTVSFDSVANIRSEGEYQLVVNDCEPVSFRVVADCSPQLFLPNAIRVSPNNPQNGIFKILNENMLANIQQFQVIIMNRWGEVIFQSTDPSFEWRGTDRRGDLVMANTYVYIITYRDMYGDEQQRTRRQRGGITVLR